MMFRKKINIYTENQLKLIKTLCWQHAECFSVEAGGSYSNLAFFLLDSMVL
jgi:hypothetical protein